MVGVYINEDKLIFAAAKVNEEGRIRMQLVHREDTQDAPETFESILRLVKKDISWIQTVIDSKYYDTVKTPLHRVPRKFLKKKLRRNEVIAEGTGPMLMHEVRKEIARVENLKKQSIAKVTTLSRKVVEAHNKIVNRYNLPARYFLLSSECEEAAIQYIDTSKMAKNFALICYKGKFFSVSVYNEDREQIFSKSYEIDGSKPFIENLIDATEQAVYRAKSEFGIAVGELYFTGNCVDHQMLDRIYHTLKIKTQFMPQPEEFVNLSEKTFDDIFYMLGVFVICFGL